MKYMTALAHAPAHITHRRFSPQKHNFQYQLQYLWFDPDQLSEICQQSPFWSQDSFNFLTLKETDFLADYNSSNDNERTIREKIQILIKNEFGATLGQENLIRVLGLPRGFGYSFNSVVFYYIFEKHQPIYILSEITNTPWGEKKIYAHDCKKGTKNNFSQDQKPKNSYDFQFSKEFHVSPFMPMDLTYSWHFNLQDEKSSVYMKLIKDEVKVFDATLEFIIQPVTDYSHQNNYAIFAPLQPFKMMTAIYWQALRLALKRVPFFNHPAKKAQQHDI